MCRKDPCLMPMAPRVANLGVGINFFQRADGKSFALRQKISKGETRFPQTLKYQLLALLELITSGTLRKENTYMKRLVIAGVACSLSLTSLGLLGCNQNNQNAAAPKVGNGVPAKSSTANQAGHPVQQPNHAVSSAPAQAMPAPVIGGAAMPKPSAGIASPSQYDPGAKHDARWSPWRYPAARGCRFNNPASRTALRLFRKTGTRISVTVPLVKDEGEVYSPSSFFIGHRAER